MKGKFIPVVIRQLVELITPSVCLGCEREGAVLCVECTNAAVLTQAAVCFRCGRESVGGRACGDCAALTPLLGVAVGAYYEGAVKELILKLKFYRLRAAAEAATGLVLAALPEDLHVDIVTAVPISPTRYRERGYNQAELVARRLAKRLGLPYSNLLGRETSAHQMGLDRTSRLAQIKGSFYPLREIGGRRVLVVDDVVTTGATLTECAEVLTAAGADEVWGAAVARH
jgi:competence protein ComFC